jgi:isopenicillin-N epimerase
VRAPAPKFGHALLRNWRLESDILYLNHGGYGAPALTVARAAEEWRKRAEANPTRFFEETLGPEIRRNAGLLGAFLNAEGQDIVLVDNVTAGINAVLRSLVLIPGDEIVATSHLYQSTRRTLEFVCERAGARLVLADLAYPVRSEGEITASIMGALSPRTRLVMLDHVTANTALRLPVETLSRRCAERGIPVMVDGTHGPGNVAVDLGELGAAGVRWYVGSGHHWLGAAFGCAFLWVHPDRQGLVRPTAISTRFGEGFTESFDWPGAKDFGAWLSLSEALRLQDSYSAERIRAYTHDLAAKAAERLSRRWRTPLGAPLSMFSAMASVALPTDAPATEASASRIREQLREGYRIEVTVTPFAGRLWVRLSAYLYNEPEDYDRLSDAVVAITGATTLAASG